MNSRSFAAFVLGIAFLVLPGTVSAAPPNGDPARVAEARAQAAQTQPAAEAPRTAPAEGLPAPAPSQGQTITSLAPPRPIVAPEAATIELPENPQGPGAGRDLSGTVFGRTLPPSTVFSTQAAPPSILYAPSRDDDPAYRAAIAALTGGTVDYYDARAGTPSAALLSSYQAVYTWASYSYSDPVLFGNRLADYVDAGGKVILGVWCTYTLGNYLAGRIMTVGYSPVTSPTGDNHMTLSPYVGDGTTSLHAGVLAYDSAYRDILVTQGAGVVDGHYADGEIALAYRPDGRVIYVNGGGTAGAGGTGDWPQIIANAAMGIPTAPGVLYAPASSDDPTYRANISSFTGGPVNYFDARAASPSAALLATYDAVYTHTGQTYFDRAVMGNRLADFVDAGGKVVLGVGCVYNDVTGGTDYSIGGRIRLPRYSPVNALPDHLHGLSPSPYVGDGTTCLHAGVAAYDCAFRDVLFAQGLGIVDGHFTDGEIAHAYRPDGRVVYSNGSGAASALGTGDWPRLVANAITCSPAGGPRMLYAPADVDDPAYRAKIAEATGGPVDYFDARAATPTLAQMSAYDCVYTHPNSGYSDPTLFGDRLADYVDSGRKVILGIATSIYLGGRINTPGYSPVTTTPPTLIYSTVPYANDGTTTIHHGVLAYDCGVVREVVTLQGAGAADGSYTTGEIAAAYRPDRRVVYLNGTGHASFMSTGDWPFLVANACMARVTGGALYASNSAGEYYSVDRTTGLAYPVGFLPTYGGAGATEIEAEPLTGQAWLQGGDGSFIAQPFSVATGTALGAPVGNGYAFNGLEFALGRLYGTAISGSGGPSDLRILTPGTGASALIGPTGFGPISGLAFKPRTSAMYGIIGGGGPVNLVRMDLTSGEATVIGPVPVQLGSIEFGPDGDLYGVGNNAEGGDFFRISPTTGHTELVGPSGVPGFTGLTLAPQGTVDAAGPSRAELRVAFAPNPSRDGPVRISFSLPVAGDATLELFDLAGRRVWRHALPGAAAGEHSIAWDGIGSSGHRAGPGIYFLRFTTPAGSREAKLIRL